MHLSGERTQKSKVAINRRGSGDRRIVDSGWRFNGSANGVTGFWPRQFGFETAVVCGRVRWGGVGSVGFGVTFLLVDDVGFVMVRMDRDSEAFIIHWIF